MATITFKNINKIYDNNVQAVFDFNLEIKDEEFIVFVGPSGCGKSTTLRMVAGLEDITSGELYIDGKLVNNVVPKDRDIAMVFQSYALYPQMTVFENMAFALKVRKIKMPLLDASAANLEIKKELDETYVKVKRIDRKFAKKQDSEELLNAHMELFDQIFELKEQYDASLKPTYGIDVKEIANSKTTIKKLMKEIAAAEKTLVSLKAKQDKGLLIPVEGTTYDSIKSVVVSAIEQKTTQIKELEERIAFLEKNEVQLFEKRHLTPLEIAIEINKTALLLDLTKYLFRKPKALSGGQRQRVALGRAIVRKPKVYLMDEPLSNLDAKLRAAMRAEISKIHENTGGTTIYVTHDQVEAMTMATRIVVMKDGWIQQIGTPDEVYSDPANKFVAGFIGAPNMNFIDALVQNKQLIISDDKGKYVIDLNAKQAKCLQAYENQEITIGIRPEAIVLEKEKGDTLVSKPLELECYYAELLGSELLLHFDFFGTKITAKTEALHKIKTYDLVSICFKIEHIYFFDKETDQRIK